MCLQASGLCVNATFGQSPQVSFKKGTSLLVPDNLGSLGILDDTRENPRKAWEFWVKNLRCQNSPAQNKENTINVNLNAAVDDFALLPAQHTDDELEDDDPDAEDTFRGKKSDKSRFGPEGTKDATVNWFKQTQSTKLRLSNGGFHEWFHGIITRRYVRPISQTRSDT